MRHGPPDGLAWTDVCGQRTRPVRQANQRQDDPFEWRPFYGDARSHLIHLPQCDRVSPRDEPAVAEYWAGVEAGPAAGYSAAL